MPKYPERREQLDQIGVFVEADGNPVGPTTEELTDSGTIPRTVRHPVSAINFDPSLTVVQEDDGSVRVAVSSLLGKLFAQFAHWVEGQLYAVLGTAPNQVTLGPKDPGIGVPILLDIVTDGLTTFPLTLRNSAAPPGSAGLFIVDAFGNVVFAHLPSAGQLAIKADGQIVIQPANAGASVDLAGCLILDNVPPAAGAAGQVVLGSRHQTTVGAAGGASALPATPLGFLEINVEGTAAVMPYYPKA
jgi:hypothetical protein